MIRRFILAVSLLLPSISSGASELFDAKNDIHAHLMFDDRLAEDAASMARIASRYDLIWGAGRTKPARELKSDLRLVRIFPMGFDPEPEDGQFSRLKHFQTEHPQWVLYRCDGQEPAYWREPGRGVQTRDVPLDFSQPEAFEWLATTHIIPAIEEGYDAIAFDFVSPSNRFGACIRKNAEGEAVRLYSGEREDPAFAAATASFLAAVRKRFSKLSLLATLDGEELGQAEALAAQLDGIQFEARIAEWNFETWRRRLALLSEIQAKGKTLLFSVLFPDDNDLGAPRLEFGLAAYLTVKGESASVWIGRESDFGKETWDPALTLPVGAPCGPTAEEKGLFVRAHRYGLSLINPDGDFPALYQLPAGRRFLELGGGRLNEARLTLAPKTGKVLLTEEPLCP